MKQRKRIAKRTTDQNTTFKTKKALGQHLLNNQNIAARIVGLADLSERDTVLEIGPGTGNLTIELLKTGARIVAVEPDREAITHLEARFTDDIARKKLVIFEGDIRTIPFETLGLNDRKYRVVSNIPYYISGLLLRLVLTNPLQPTEVIFLVQKEVAERVAQSTKESLLSLSVKAYGMPRYSFTVKRGSFTPAPKVDSAVLHIEHISRDSFTTRSEADFFTLLHHGFGSRRKQLFGLLKEHYPHEVLDRAFSEATIPKKARGEDVGIETWYKLYDALQ
jgi:16S rRNA (adenine1518-N6/adenine1519-N6)-dimethyltransferase